MSSKKLWVGVYDVRNTNRVFTGTRYDDILSPSRLVVRDLRLKRFKKKKCIPILLVCDLCCCCRRHVAVDEVAAGGSHVSSARAYHVVDDAIMILIIIMTYRRCDVRSVLSFFSGVHPLCRI